MQTNEKAYETNMFRSVKLGENILVTTEHGSWVFLTPGDYKKLTSGRIEEKSELFRLLEANGVIVTEKNIRTIIREYQSRKNYLFQGTSLHIIAPTLKCNQNCTYCQQNNPDLNDKSHMNLETAKKVVDFIFQSPSENITIEFQGGEPLLEFDLLKSTIEHAKKKNEKAGKNLKFSVVTNLTLMTEDKLDYFMSNRIGICTSLDGPKDVHNTNRVFYDGSGSYDDVVKWIDFTRKKYGDKAPLLNALITTTKQSLGKWKEIVDEYVRFGFRYIDLRPINKLGMASDNWKDIGYSPEEFFDFWSKSLEYIVNLNLNGTDLIERQTMIILEKILTINDPMFTDMQSPCGGIITQLAYDHNGDIYTCDEARTNDLFKLGNVRDKSYEDVLTSPKSCAFISASVNDVYICDNCAWKPYCGICIVCSYKNQGNIITKLPIDDKCKTRKMLFRHIFEKFLFDERYKRVFSLWLKKTQERKEKEYNEAKI